MRFKYYALKIVFVCVIIFFFQIIFLGFTDLFVLNELSFTQPWRFVTSIFLHGDIGHLLYNMFALALFGSMLEGMINGRRFLIVYFASGIFANLISINFYNSSLGASGAIYGIIGALVIVRPLLMVWAFGFPMPMILAGLLWAAGDAIGLFIPSNVGHIAHLTGMAMGLILGIVFRGYYNRNQAKKSYGAITVNESKMRQWEDSYLR